MVDPARTSDPTGIVGIEGNLQTGENTCKICS